MDFGPARILPLLVLTLLLCSNSFAQNSRNNKSEPAIDLRKNTEETSLGKPEFTDYELLWTNVDSHSNAKLSVWGKDYDFSQLFENGEAPFFNAFEEELAPGKYTYSILFTPDELVNYQNALSQLSNERKQLIKKRRVALEAGDQQAAATLLKQANDCRSESVGLMEKQLDIKQPSFQTLVRYGQFIVKEDHTIVKFDLKQIRNDAAREAAEERKSKRSRSKKPNFDDAH